MKLPSAILIAARRSAIGRIGGMHRSRRLEELSGPVLSAALADAKCEPNAVNGFILGNTMAGGNAARAVALASGLPDTTYSVTLDSQCASGLEAILAAFRRIAAGEADILVAGGAESPSTAPWRIARPKNPYQMPRFIGVEPRGADASGDPCPFAASDALARQFGISRSAQDTYAAQSHLAASLARERRQFIGEIAPIRINPEELRDQVNPASELSDLEELAAFQPDGGTLTPGNTSALADGAAFAVIVSGAVWKGLGQPKGLVLQGCFGSGVAARSEGRAGLAALEGLIKRCRDAGKLAAIETSEASAAEAIAMVRSLELADGVLNASGGAIVRGHPLAASSAVSVVRLFSRLVRAESPIGKTGAVTQSATGGLGLAAIFETTG